MTNVYKPEGARISTIQNREYVSSLSGLEKALERQLILEAPAILCDHNFNLHISLGGGISGIIPRDECEYIKKNEEIKDIAILTRVGKPVCFKVLGFKRNESGGTIAVLSRKAAQRECVLNYVSGLVSGDIIPARVTHLESFGAFVDIGCGIISLLSIDCISVSRISHPSARLSVGDTMFAVVKSIDDKGRVYITERELLGSWEENVSRFSEGQTVRGVVRSIESYGIFVELAPNLAGLAEYKENVYPEQTAAVYIKSIIADKMKVKLIIIDTADEPLYRQPLEYFIDPEKTRHIDKWTYSPPGCKKLIESSFG
ncbi:MAG: S1 RNA-binding domain-containing protein [Ruminococcaceae bacterium]|nr:S1 RNA-binding domain-containing protein [Oscillospiraceae bacterium]